MLGSLEVQDDDKMRDPQRGTWKSTVLPPLSGWCVSTRFRKACAGVGSFPRASKSPYIRNMP